MPIADLGVHPGAARPVRVNEQREELVRARQFVTELVRLGAGDVEMPEPHGCQLWIAIEGSGTIGGEAYRRGEVWLLPEGGVQPAVGASEPSRFLRTWAP